MIVLVGVDDSDTARRAAEAAAALASAHEAELHVASAFTVKVTDTFQMAQNERRSPNQSRAYRSLEERLYRYSEGVVSLLSKEIRAKFPGLVVVPKVLYGSPGAALVDESKRINANVVVVGNKRVQGPTRILGSIARTVASEVNCDLYLVNTYQGQGRH